VKHRKGLARYIEIVVLVLLGIPVGVLIMAVGLQCHFPTPGVYVFRLFPVTHGWIGVQVFPELLSPGS
jgi:hypothetical protein